MIKRILLVAALLVVVLGVAGFLVFHTISQTGSGTLEKWIGEQLQGIVNSYLNPRLSFDNLDYQYPGTVTLKNLRLVADDPGSPGKTIDILGCSSATITLAEVPTLGKPIVIEKIILDHPLISAVAVSSGSRQFVGFSGMVKGSGPTTGESKKLSDYFHMRLVQINDGRIQYDPRVQGTEPMVLDQINTSLDIQPTEDGWYKLATTIKRVPIFQLDLAGELNLDNFSTRQLDVKLAANLTPDNLNYLPPQIQQQLKTYEVAGILNTHIASSQLLLTDPFKGQADLDLTMADAHCAIGKYRFPIKSMQMQAHMNNGALTLPQLKLAALEGNADISGSARLDGQFDTNLRAVIAGMLIEDVITTADGEPVRSAGKIDADLQLNAPMKIVLAKANPGPDPAAQAAPLPDQWGSAQIHIVDGRLVDLPLIKQISSAVGEATNFVRASISLPAKPSEHAVAAFDMKNDQAVFSTIDYTGEVIAVRGKGNISLDRKLDLLVNGGPVERIQKMLGQQIGGTIAKVTDPILSYHVTGTMGDPKITPQIGHGSVSDVGKGVQSGAESIGEGITHIGEGIGQGIGNIIKPKDGDGK